MNVGLMAQRKTEIDARAIDVEVGLTKGEDSGRSRAVHKLREGGRFDSVVRIEIVLTEFAGPPIANISPTGSKAAQSSQTTRN